MQHSLIAHKCWNSVDNTMAQSGGLIMIHSQRIVHKFIMDLFMVGTVLTQIYTWRWFDSFIKIHTWEMDLYTVYPKKYAHGFCFVVVIHWLIFPYPSGLLHWHCGNLTICPSASKATLMNMDKYFMWIHYERLHNHNKAKHNKTVCIFLGIYCMVNARQWWW